MSKKILIDSLFGLKTAGLQDFDGLMLHTVTLCDVAESSVVAVNDNNTRNINKLVIYK